VLEAAVVVEPADELPAAVVPGWDDDPVVEGAPVLDEEPDPGVLAVAGAGLTAGVAPPFCALLLPHAVSTKTAAQSIGAAAQFLSDKYLFISVILRFDSAGGVCSQASSSAACLPAETVSGVRLSTPTGGTLCSPEKSTTNLSVLDPGCVTP